MNELDKLKLHLTNLQEAGHKEFNVNVEWLMSVIDTIPKSEQTRLSGEIEIDAGTFDSQQY
jgi:hypothetical protein